MEKASRDDVDGHDSDPFGVQYIRDEFYARRQEDVDARPSTSQAPNLFDAQYFEGLYDAQTESAEETLPLYADERWTNVRKQTSDEGALWDFLYLLVRSLIFLFQSPKHSHHVV